MMKYLLLTLLLLAALPACPVMAEPAQTVPTNAPEPGAMPFANVTAPPTTPVPVTSGIPATVVPTNAPAAAPTAVPTDMMTVALTTIALPPHEQETGLGLPADPGVPGQSGAIENPSVTEPGITEQGLDSAAASNKWGCESRTFRVDCKILWLNTKRFDYSRNCKWTSDGCSVNTKLVSDAICFNEKTFFWDNFVILYAELSPGAHCVQ